MGKPLSLSVNICCGAIYKPGAPKQWEEKAPTVSLLKNKHANYRKWLYQPEPQQKQAFI